MGEDDDGGGGWECGGSNLHIVLGGLLAKHGFWNIRFLSTFWMDQNRYGFQVVSIVFRGAQLHKF
jgi:hypothetical protein